MDDLDQLLASIMPDGEHLETSRLPSSRSLKIAAKTALARVDREAALTDIIDGPPEPGTSLHIISAAKWDFWTWIPCFLRWIGGTEDLYCSTWTASRPNVDELFELMNAGHVCRAHFLTGTYFKRREATVAANLIAGLQSRPGSRFVAFQNHAKVALLQNGDDWLSIEGSANLTSNPRLEQYVVTNSRDLYEFHRAWMNEAFDKGDKALAEPTKPRERKPGYSQRRAGLGTLAAVVDNRSRKHVTTWKLAPIVDTARLETYAAAVAEMVRHWLPILPPDCVVTWPPQGASFPGQHYAAALARRVAELLELPARDLLSRTSQKKEHGPAASLAQTPFETTETPPANVIVVDDLITTGKTMTHARNALSAAGAVNWGFAYAGA